MLRKEWEQVEAFPNETDANLEKGKKRSLNENSDYLGSTFLREKASRTGVISRLKPKWRGGGGTRTSRANEGSQLGLIKQTADPHPVGENLLGPVWAPCG